MTYDAECVPFVVHNIVILYIFLFYRLSISVFLQLSSLQNAQHLYLNYVQSIETFETLEVVAINLNLLIL